MQRMTIKEIKLRTLLSVNGGFSTVFEKGLGHQNNKRKKYGITTTSE